MDYPVSKKLEIIIPAYRMHTQSFNNALDEVSEEDARLRIENVTNHIIWMVGNLVNCRYWLANILGIENKDPHEDLFKDAKALDMSLKYPSLDDLKNEWHKISPELYHKLSSITDEELNESIDFRMGISFIQENKLNMIGMGIGREDYLVGQIGLMRRVLGYKGMKYDVDETIKY